MKKLTREEANVIAANMFTEAELGRIGIPDHGACYHAGCKYRAIRVKRFCQAHCDSLTLREKLVDIRKRQA